MVQFCGLFSERGGGGRGRAWFILKYNCPQQFSHQASFPMDTLRQLIPKKKKKWKYPSLLTEFPQQFNHQASFPIPYGN